jgi:acetylglutamate kinase
MKILVKLGGSLLDCAASRARLAAEIARASECDSIVVVHGGGKQMTRFLAERGIESKFINGLRVTTDEVLDAVMKIFAGSVNAELVSALRAAGASPVGLSGLDAGLVDAELLDPALGHVGRPVHSDPRLLNVLIGAHFLPVVACVAGDAGGARYNVNGDQMAVACAAGWKADRLIFLTDVEGVRDGDGKICAALTAGEARGLICDGIATGGMQAKLEAALSGLSQGVAEINISSGSVDGILGKLIANNGYGTRMVSEK